MIQAIKAIATDLDGTLLNSNHELTPRTERTLKRAIAQGVQVILATGKTAASREEPVRRLGLTTPGVYSQGLVLVDGTGAVYSQQTLANTLATTIVHFAEEHRFPVAAYSGYTIYARQFSSLTNTMMAHHEPPPQIVASLPEITSTVPINKVVMEVNPESALAVIDALHTRVNGSVALLRSMPQMIEVLPRGASKGAGLHRLLDDMGIKPGEIMAFGDGENDTEMLQMAGFGVAMANAMPALKAVADHITATNDEDGVALAVEQFVLRPQ